MEKIIEGYPFVSHTPDSYPEHEMLERSHWFYAWINGRRSIRDFSNKNFDREIIDNAILAASTAPSGAHKQPWTFCVVSNPELKKEIRIAAEKEEYESYNGRMSQEWIEDLRPLQTNWEKPFLETVPYLIVVFKQVYQVLPNGAHRNNYYVNESVGLACGMLLTALHYAGLSALTHTPSPMNFLSKILSRPENERPYLLIPVGFPVEDALVPKLTRKPLEMVAAYYN